MMHQTFVRRAALFVVSVLAMFISRPAAAQPTAVEHTPSLQAFGQATGVTQREPDVPREDEAVDLYIRVSFQFAYDRVCVYYTRDGSEPSGAFGTPTGTTQVLRNDLGSVTFVTNENSGGVRDWWKATLPSPTRQWGPPVKYKLAAWKQFSGGEVFANSGTSYSYSVKLAWPGAGAGQVNPGAGYPPVSFWKEEATIGNTYCAAMLDQNGTYYDFHFPSPGCVQGVGTRNEGYVDGADTFPPLLPAGWRGQMHLNQAMVGIRFNGLTHWLSNPNGVSYSNVSQSYTNDETNSVTTTQTLQSGNDALTVRQYDFAPYGIDFPTNQANAPERHIVIKRVQITNASAFYKTFNVYFYMDPALNGGDGHDAMFFDPVYGAMTAYDKTTRDVTGTGSSFSDPNEYNPTTFGAYHKNIALYLTAVMQEIPWMGSTNGYKAYDSWRDTSTDSGQGWIGRRGGLLPGQSVEYDFALIGTSFRPPNPLTDPMPVNDGVYDTKTVPVLEWFFNTSMATVQSQTDAAWASWLNAGVTVDTPDAGYDTLFKRALLATELHVDGVSGAIIAGFHNGAYPFCWPRDAVYAAITLARTGHLSEAANVYAWMRDTCFRDDEPAWGFNSAAGRTYKGFWKQKYSTDGYVVWGAPQIDETACYPWGLNYQYQMTADTGFLSSHYVTMREAVRAMSEDSQDSRLYFVDPPGTGPGTQNLMHSNNVWEDSYSEFLYSNANVYRGLDDARAISTVLGNAADASDAAGRRNTIKSGLDGRLAVDTENTDISLLGVSYPFGVYAPTDARVAHLADRINGVATDGFGQNHPLVNFGGEHAGTINRYHNDGYWNGGPWFLSTLWYGLYYAQRQDLTAGTADIDNHKSRIDLCIDRLGPVGLGSEQIAFSNSYLYPGQGDLVLQAAWPNAWESMSTIADSITAFLGYRPDAPANAMVFQPKLPSAWGSMTFRNITMVHAPTSRTHKVDLTVSDSNGHSTAAFTNTSGHDLDVLVTLRVPPGSCVFDQFVTRDGVPVASYSYNSILGTVIIGTQPLNTGPGATTTFDVWRATADFDRNTFVNGEDFDAFVDAFYYGQIEADFDGNGFVNGDDFDYFTLAFVLGC